MRSSKWVASTVFVAMFPVSVLQAQPAKTKVATSASAAPPAAPAPAPPAIAPTPDVVRLKSGAFFRGTLVQHDPKGRTVLQTATGTKDLDGADVAYAGPVAADPGAGGTAPPASVAPPVAAPPPVAPAPPPPVTIAPVQLRANLPGVQFYLQRSRDVLMYQGQTVQNGLEAANYQLLCAAPCSAPLPPGSYRFGLADGESAPVAADAPVQVRPGSTVEGTVVSRAGQRTAGNVLFFGGIVVMSLSVVPVLAGGSGERGETPGLPLALGMVVAGGAGAVTGLFLRRVTDDVSVRVAAADHPVRTSVGPVAAEPRPLGTSFGGQF